ncbi:MAG TPA: TolC family protein [Terriglobales bacterium]|jgi:outer membrane protein TolC|nr:TolC family protein [Terriglobales bacterium]
MKLRLNVFLFSAAMLFATASRAETLPLERAIRLALTHSTTSAIAGADVQHAFAAFREVRNSYVPQLMLGSGLGYSYGFPLTLEGSAPAIVNVVAQSTVFNPSQRQFQNAARTEWRAAQFQDKSQRNAVIQDVTLTYAELAKWDSRLARLQEDQAEATRLEKAVAQRLQEGIDSSVDLNRAKLTGARARLRIAEARGAADVLRHHLFFLTGLPLSSLEVASETIPALPDVSPEDDLAAKAVAASPAIQSADQHALAEIFRASGEHRALLPSVDFAAQYARLSTYNNYDQYYRKYQPDNATFGVSIRIPIFNASQRARAQGADAEALKAKKQAEAARNEVFEETLKLQRSVEQLAAAREVAQLEYQLAQSGLDAAQTRLDAGTGAIRDLVDARGQASERYLLFQDSDFEYQRARVTLLRVTGDLEKWALPNPAN